MYTDWSLVQGSIGCAFVYVDHVFSYSPHIFNVYMADLCALYRGLLHMQRHIYTAIFFVGPNRASIYTHRAIRFV
jgi:hypothetical protein